ncbi:hypothetical protein D3C80_2187440 [compost metagenome]
MLSWGNLFVQIAVRDCFPQLPAIEQDRHFDGRTEVLIPVDVNARHVWGGRKLLGRPIIIGVGHWYRSAADQ